MVSPRQFNRVSDAVKQDHAEITTYYNEFCKAAGNTDVQERWANQLKWEVARHSVGEEIVIYPLFEKHLGQKGRDMAEKDRNEHQAVKEQLYKLEKLEIGTAAFNSTLQETMADLKKHIESEEKDDLPALESILGLDDSRSAASSFVRTKKFAPTHPHPGAPNKPPFETVAGLMTAPVDKLRDLFNKFPTEEMKRQADNQ